MSMLIQRSCKWRSVLAFFMLLMLSVTAMADTLEQRQRADDLFAASRFKEALPIYEGLLDEAEGQDAVEIQKQIAYCCMRVYKRTRTVTEYLKLAEMDDVDAVNKSAAYKNAGYGLRLQGKYEASLPIYDKAINTEGADPTTVSESWLSKGHAFNKLNRSDEAAAAYRSGADVKDAHWVTRMTNLVALGTLHQNAENYKQAEAAFKEAIVLGPNHHYGHVAKNRLIECQVAQKGSDAFYIDPYVTHLTEDGADIYWISRHDASQGRATVTRSDGQNPQDTRVIPATRSDMKGNTAFRQTAAVSGLEAATQYTYTIECDGEVRTGTFYTAPTEPQPVRFAVLGDTQGGHARHARVAESIAEFNPRFVLHVGDCVERGDRWDEWKVQLFDPGMPYLRKSGFWPARGNHDGGAYYDTFFGREDRMYEDFRFGSVHVFVMDSYSSTGGSLREEQLAWLDESMGNSDARWKVVALHHPMVHTPATEPLFGTEDFLPMLEKHGADIVLTGHYHIYQRLLPMGPKGSKPVVHITTGGGGGNMGSRTPSPLIVHDYMDIHHLRFLVDGDTLEMKAVTPEGALIDEMTLEKIGDNYQPEVMARQVDTPLGQKARLLYHLLSHVNARISDLEATFTDIPEPGQPVTLTLVRNLLDDEKIPADSKLIISSPDGAAWQIEEQTLDISNNQWTFTAIAPEKPYVEDVRLLPQFEATLNLQVGDYNFEPDTFKLMVTRAE